MENVKKKIPSIKILPEYFEEVLAGRKRAELRLNDRNYKKGDIYMTFVNGIPREGDIPVER